MSAANIDVVVAPKTAVDALVNAIAMDGYAIARDALPQPAVAALRERVLALDAAGELVRAGVGRGNARRERADIRGDRIGWLDTRGGDPAEAAIHALFERVRGACNRALMLGLVGFDCHYALYPPGTRYARHRDRFRDDDTRVLSCVLYLNERWLATDGGALRLYLDDGEARDIVPAGGTLVAFLAARFEHEVLPAVRSRLSISAWFRRRSL